MDQEELQVQNDGLENTAQLSDMSADELAASLALATRLSEDMLRSANPQMNEEETLPEEEMPQIEENAEEQEVVEEESNEEFKEEIRTIIQEEIGSLKDLIKEVLEEEKDDDDDK